MDYISLSLEKVKEKDKTAKMKTGWSLEAGKVR